MIKKLTKVDSSMVYAVGYDRESKHWKLCLNAVAFGNTRMCPKRSIEP
jgi:hypothetical protein